MRAAPGALGFLAVAACAAAPTLPPVRFANAPAVTAVNDRRDVPAQPAKRDFLPSLYNYLGTVERRLTRALELPRPQRALGVNALDEVPDSTWFTNRIGVRDLAPEEVRTGPLTADSPELHRPWTVRSTKVGGASIGFVIADARGIKYLLKFDPAGSPETETGIDVIVNRLLWAAGYNVSEDQIVYFRDEDLVVAPDAAVKNDAGARVGPLDRAGLEQRLAKIDHGKDGQIRGLVSRWIDGKTIGGHPGEGVRGDDPNDLIPHELRRDLRGAYPIFAWVDHVDIHEGNFVDSWVADPADSHRHYVRHYFVDFGRSLGGMARFQLDWRRGHTYVIDLADILLTTLTFGLLDRDWHHRSLEPLPRVASFDAATFDPGGWHPDWPAYVPFLTADRIDKLWGAKIVARFTRPQIEAAIEAARLTDPIAARYIADTLVARQCATMEHWFARVAPLDHFSITEDLELCFDDLALAHAVADPSATRYTITAYDRHARTVADRVELGGMRGGHRCGVVPVAPDTDRDGYTILRIVTTRPGFSGETFVHLAKDPASHRPRVIGIWRS